MTNEQETQQSSESAALPVSQSRVLPLTAEQVQTAPTTESKQSPKVGTEQTKEKYELHWDYSKDTHDYIRDMIKFADQKAAFLFALSTAFMAFLYKNQLLSLWISNPKEWTLLQITSLAAALGLTISATLCVWTILPNMNGSKRSVVFFGGISQYDNRSEFFNSIIKHTQLELLNEKLTHIYDIAVVCTSKYSSLKYGIISGAVGVASTLILLLLS